MVLKAVCVLKGAGETSGTVYFEQEVRRAVVFIVINVLFVILGKLPGDLTCILLGALAHEC